MNTQELYTEAHRLFSYDAETGLLTRKVAALNRWGKPNPKPNCKISDVVGCDNGKGYLQVRFNGKLHYVHRLAWLMQTGASPKEHIDHINGNPLDNRLVNLREANQSENMCNRGKNSNNTTGFKGVYVESKGSKNRYKSQISLNGKQIYIGAFPTPERAHEAYCNKAKELHGEFAWED